MAIGALPGNIITTSNILWNYADDSWFLAGKI